MGAKPKSVGTHWGSNPQPTLCPTDLAHNTPARELPCHYCPTRSPLSPAPAPASVAPAPSCLPGEGASVVVGARRQPELDLLVEEIRHEGGQAVSLAGDVKSETYARALVDLALTRFGGLDIAFNNAGTTGTPCSVEQLELTQWQEILDTNLTSAFVGAKYQIPAMLARGGGSLIFTSTFVGHTLGLPGMAAYAASKAGLIGLTRVLAAEYGAQGVRVNALLPGGTDTPMGRAFANTAREPRLCAEYACPQTAGPTGGDRPLGPLSRVRCIQLYPRHCPAGRWWGINLSHMTLSSPTPCDRNLIVRAPYV